MLELGSDTGSESESRSGSGSSDAAMLTNTKSTSPTVINSTSLGASLVARFDVAQVCDSWYYTKREAEGVKVGRGEVGT
jgi:hypothetical protein